MLNTYTFTFNLVFKKNRKTFALKNPALPTRSIKLKNPTALSWLTCERCDIRCQTWSASHVCVKE